MQASHVTSAIEPSKWNGRIFGGTWTEPRGGGHDVIEKATGEVLTRVGMASPADIAAAAKAATAAQPAWAAMAPRDRAGVFRKAVAFFEAHAEEIAVFISRETGGILPKARHEVHEI